jgi:competence protein ComEC
MFKSQRNTRAVILFVLLGINVGIYYTIHFESRDNLLTVAFLDIGQGDSIYIEAPNGNQVIFDGGPNGKLLAELGKILPFYDRSIDMLVVTNPDKDHYGGFIDLLRSYRVDKVLEPGTKSSTETYRMLKASIKAHNIPNILARRGMKIILDDDPYIHIDVLFPDRDVSGMKTNPGSIVAKLVYGNTSVMLTGDSPQEIESYLTAIDGKNLRSDVLKVGHHGSRTSTGVAFLGFVAPTYAVISDGKGNTYGHPHKETLDNLAKFNVKVLRTDELGTVLMKSDGENIIFK